MSHEELDIEAQLDRMLDEASESAAASAADESDQTSEALEDQAELLGDMETVEQVVASAGQTDPDDPSDAPHDEDESSALGEADAETDDDGEAGEAVDVVEPAAAAAKSSLSDDDLADQIQKMLNAASEQAANPSAADIAADKADQLPANEQSPEQVIAQIDDQLADEADDDIVGDFESIEDVVQPHQTTGDQKSSAQAAASSADEHEPESEPDRPGPGAPPNDDDEDALAGDMQSVDEAVNEMIDSPESAAAAGAKNPRDRDEARSADSQADAAAVAAELDADEALHRRRQPATDDHRDEEAIDRPSGAGDHDQPLDRAASTATPAPVPAHKAPKPAGPGALIRIMATLNRPLQSVPRSMRDFVGFFGLTLLFWAVCLFGAAFGGFMTAVIAGAVALPGLLAVFYLLFIRQGPDIIHN